MAVKRPAPPPARLVHSPHPILAGEGRMELAAAVRTGETLAEFLARFGVTRGHAQVVVCVNDQVVPRARWGITFPAPGDLITARAVVQDGDGGDSNKVLRTVLTIAVLAAAAYAAPALAGTLGIHSAAGIAATQAVLAVGGSLLVTALLPPPSPRLPTGESESPTYALSGGANRARPFEPLPLVVGKHRMWADHGAQPYTDFGARQIYWLWGVYADQILYQVFNFGLSDIVLSDFRIGDTSTTDYEEVDIEESGTDGALTLFPANVDTLAGADLTASAGWVTRTSSVGTTGLQVDITGLLFRMEEWGMEFHSVDLELEYRAVGAGTWSPFLDIGSGFTLKNNSRRPIRWAAWRDVPEDQYEVRARRVSAADTNPNHVSTITWANLKSFQPDTADYTGQKRVALRIKATGQLNGRVEAFNAMASARCEAWSGSAWVPDTETSNPAWWFRWFAKGKKDASGRRLYGANLADAQLDEAAIQAWGAFCTAKGLEVNWVIDRRMSVWEVLGTIARCGRGIPTWANGKLGVVWDAQGQAPVQMFGENNIRKGTLQVTYLTRNLGDEIVAEFINSANGYQLDTVRAPVPGVANPERPIRVQLMGVTDEAQAGKEANLLAAAQVYRRKRSSWESDLEALVCQRGDVVVVTHPLPSWDHGGRLVAGTTTVLQLDNAVPFTPSASHYIRVRQPDGSFADYAVTYQAGESATITLTDPLPTAPDADPNHEPMDYTWQFGPSTSPGQMMKVVDVQPVSEHHVRLAAVPEGDAYYLAEDNVYTYVPPSTFEAQVPTIVNLEVMDTLERAGAGYVSRIAVAWDVTGAYGSAIVRAGVVDPDTGNWTLEEQGRTFGRRLEFIGPASGQIRVEVTALNLKTEYGAGSRSAVTYPILGKDRLPADVTGFSATQNGPVVVFKWAKVADVDLSGYEIRFGPQGAATWADATPLTEVTKGTQITTAALPPGSWTTLIKAVDTSENESANAASADIEVQNALDIIFQEQQATAWPGMADEEVNLLANPNALNLSPWQALAVTVTADAAIAPDGSMTAEELKADTTTGNRWVMQSITKLPQKNRYLLEADVQYVNHAEVGLQVYDNNPSASGASATFDIQQGIALALSTYGVDITPIRQGITPADEGYWHIVFEFESSAWNQLRAALRFNGTTVAGVSKFNAWGVKEFPRRGYVKHWTGVLVPSSVKSAGEHTNAELFTQFVPYPMPTSIYEAPEIDIGWDDYVRIWADIASALGPGISQGVADPALEIDYRLDAGSYSGWKPWVAGQIKARYFKQRLVQDSSRGNAKVTGFLPTVDVEERREEAEGLVVASGTGTAVVFATPFHVKPVVRVDLAEGETQARIPTYESLSGTGFTVHVRDTGGNSVGGTVNWRAEGV